ncbi:MAG TPA: hypothetical protein ENH16_04070 [Desulfobacteraceae bacterium]|nr:hypothetical protein [Desulfobacteraceae bacterium]
MVSPPVLSFSDRFRIQSTSGPFFKNSRLTSWAQKSDNHPDTGGILTEYLTARPLFYKCEKIQALFVSKKGNRLAIRTTEDNMKNLVSRADLAAHFNVSCHTLRHTFASH